MRCEHLTMPASISPRADNGAKSCRREATTIVRVRRFTGAVHEYRFCTQHSNTAVGVVDRRKEDAR